MVKPFLEIEVGAELVPEKDAKLSLTSDERLAGYRHRRVLKKDFAHSPDNSGATLELGSEDSGRTPAEEKRRR
ncbi:MAG: hypothetical protein AB1491_06140 [Thermodesulfobacteriota bacterium]